MSELVPYREQITGLMPSMSLANAVQRYNAVVEFVKTVMTPSKDYGTIPGAGDKPTLLKPGAEKLVSFFGLRPEFIPAEKIVNFETGLFFYQYACNLYRISDGSFVGSGLGSCNSRETKYRYRWIPSDNKPSKADGDALKARGLGRWRKNGNDWVWNERVENTEPFDLVNTIDKMAQKRALVAAVLITCNASEFFTQDIEDMSIIDGEFHELPIVPVEAKTTQAQKPAQPTPDQQQFPSPVAQPATDERPANGDKFHGLQSLIDANIAENLPNAAQIANKLRLASMNHEDAIKLARLYRGHRDSGLDSDAAAVAALAGDPIKS